MNYDNRPIGVFDSGIGGLTVLKHLVRLMPEERFVYLGDTARVPYGNKSAETVQLYARQCGAFLCKHDVKLIVVACNTASALALDDLRAHMPVPVIGVIDPAARESIKATHNRRIGVIGTRATVHSRAYESSIQSQSAEDGITIHSVACPLFVPLVEEGWLTTPATRMIADEYTRDLRQKNVDTLVLGCTHYPMLAGVLAELMPDVTLIDCGACAAAEARALIDPCKPTSSEPKITMFVTDHTPAFANLAQQFLGFSVAEPGRVSIDNVFDHQEEA
ncbi:MAG: glutamate racemase [Ignavibacteria bacterium]|jgi:glutamate racemase